MPHLLIAIYTEIRLKASLRDAKKTNTVSPYRFWQGKISMFKSYMYLNININLNVFVINLNVFATDSTHRPLFSFGFSFRRLYFVLFANKITRRIMRTQTYRCKSPVERVFARVWFAGYDRWVRDSSRPKKKTEVLFSSVQKTKFS